MKVIKYIQAKSGPEYVNLISKETPTQNLKTFEVNKSQNLIT